MGRWDQRALAFPSVLGTGIRQPVPRGLRVKVRKVGLVDRFADRDARSHLTRNPYRHPARAAGVLAAGDRADDQKRLRAGFDSPGQWRVGWLE
jgi:hypothetical protein